MNSDRSLEMEKKFMWNMSQKTIQGKGFSGVPSFLRNVILLPVIFTFNIPLLLVNILWKRILKMLTPRKPRVLKTYPTFESDTTHQRDYDILLFGVTGQTGTYLYFGCALNLRIL